MDIDRLARDCGFDVQRLANQRKRHNKLSESFVRSYISSRLKDVRFGGRSEADKIIDKLIAGKRMELSEEIANIIAQNRAAWANFAYRIASTLDIEALTGFFVPFIYGGIITRKNATGEMVGVINISKNQAYTDKNARLFAITNEIERLRRRGVGIIVIFGESSEIYSDRMLSIYQGSRNECFLIVEKLEGEAENGSETRESLYGREVLSALCRAKNVFVVLGYDLVGEGDIPARSRALSSYGILHGAYVSGSAAKTIQKLEKGSCIAIFDSKFSFKSGFYTDFVSDPHFPVVLPDLFEGLRSLQYFNSFGAITMLSEAKI